MPEKTTKTGAYVDPTGEFSRDQRYLATRITADGSDGYPVKPGRYRLVVRERGTIHNFHFFGTGVNRETSVPGTGKHVWRVTLSPGTYTANCDPHGSMTTALEVT